MIAGLILNSLTKKSEQRNKTYKNKCKRFTYVQLEYLL